MKLLLDTQSWLWMINDPDEFSPAARRRILDEDNELLLTVVNTWELSIKYALGKLPLPKRPSEYVHRFLAAARVQPMAIQPSHTQRASELPMHLVDPFDRLLIAQAQIEDLSILTANAQFRKYVVKVLWAH